MLLYVHVYAEVCVNVRFVHFVIWVYHDDVGKRFLYWNGIEPRLCLTDTALIKEFLSKYNSISGKSWQQQQGSKHFIGKGLLMVNGEDWHHQRHLVVPAFKGERLKVYFSSLHYLTSHTSKLFAN